MKTARTYCRQLRIGLLILWVSGVGLAQTDTYVVHRQSSVRILPFYQYWSIGESFSFSQRGVGLLAYAPLSRDLGISLQTAHTSTRGDLRTLDGIADTKLSVTYAVEDRGMVLSCGVTVPTGKNELTQDEFETSVFVSQDVLDLRIPNVGQGFSLQPGVSWAVSLDERLSLGLAASYHYRAAYKPLADYGDYDPGDELLLAGGLDVPLGERATLSADIVFTAYGADKLDGQEVFSSGSKVSVNARFRREFGRQELLIAARYRTRGGSEVSVAGVRVPEEEKTAPDLVHLSGRFRLHASDRLSVVFTMEGRFFERTAAVLSDVNLFGFGLAPEIILGHGVSIPALIRYQAGKLEGGDSLTGIELGIGLAVVF